MLSHKIKVEVMAKLEWHETIVELDLKNTNFANGAQTEDDLIKVVDVLDKKADTGLCAV
jgi:hypothetical protein